MKSRLLLCAASAAAIALSMGPAAAQHNNYNDNNNGYRGDSGARNYSRDWSRDDLHDAYSQLREARHTLEHMERDSDTRYLLRNAAGIFVVPNLTRGGFMIGGRGGEGIFMTRRRDGSWSGPSFYELGGVSFGWQVGLSNGSFVFVLETPRSVQEFLHHNNFSLNANAGLSIVNYSANAQASVGKGDVVVWSNMAGAYAGATIGGTDIHWDAKETKAFYNNRNVNQYNAVFHHSPRRNPLAGVLPG